MPCPERAIRSKLEPGSAQRDRECSERCHWQRGQDWPRARTGRVGRARSQG